PRRRGCATEGLSRAGAREGPPFAAPLYSPPGGRIAVSVSLARDIHLCAHGSPQGQAQVDGAVTRKIEPRRGGGVIHSAVPFPSRERGPRVAPDVRGEG